MLIQHQGCFDSKLQYPQLVVDGSGGCHNDVQTTVTACKNKDGCVAYGQQSNGCWHLFKFQKDIPSHLQFKESKYAKHFEYYGGYGVSSETACPKIQNIELLGDNYELYCGSFSDDLPASLKSACKNHWENGKNNQTYVKNHTKSVPKATSAAFGSALRV